MVDIQLEPDDYELIEKWYGMLFGDGKQKPDGHDLMLYNKLSQMHIGHMRNEIKEAQDKLGKKDDE